MFGLKVGFTALCCAAFYLIYLDGQIRSKMDGKLWQLPAEVYGNIQSVRRSDSDSLNQITSLLLDNGYRQTNLLGTPGDFKVENDSIVLIRRAFPFPDGAEPQRVLRLRFNQNKLNVIEDLVNRRAVDEFRFDPKLIAMLQSNNEDRLATPLHQYPRLLIDTLLLVEDRRFYQHDGVSLLGISRALITNIQAGQTVQGGSTLTQQLVKNLFLSNERSLTRKVNEALMAVLMDARYDKNRILETYLNEVYLAQDGDTQIHGFALASQFFFGRPVQEISLDQIALLVGMVKGPSLYNPWRNPNNALQRRNVVLKTMLEHAIIDQKLYDLLSARPLGVQTRGSINKSQPAFMQLLQQDLQQQLGEAKANNLSGARIFTTLDSQKQRAAERALINAVQQLKIKQKIADLESAIVVADYRNGAVLAMVGGVQTQYAGFNRALRSQRQIGSLVKPPVYLAALSEPQNFRLNTPIENRPLTIKIKGSADWQPRNYDNKFGGSVMLLDALVRSLNVPTVNIGMKVGLDKVIDVQQAMGWDQIKIPKVPAMLLGSYSISPYDVTKLYQVIANEGKKIPLSAIESVYQRNGEVIYQRAFEPQQVVAEEAAIQTLYAMQQAVERGTGRSLQQNFAQYRLAGKTGTTNEARDTWFVGIDGENVTTVWLGRDNNGKTGLTGASGALSVYREYLSLMPPTVLNLPKSDNLQWVGINDYGSWNCNSSRTIPVWTDKNQNFCASASAVVPSGAAPAAATSLQDAAPSDVESAVERQPSVWDALELQQDSAPAPVEDAQPSR
ncbi:penicillin-binding protein 1B [Pasteurellaceae bacterium USgator11]|nr:penicillin-binding protein 1B [Pasteurellaceae bacterium UScroc12]TNG94981.1 penicillin-binding protein 1B [Pasteurellaceae bacterium USgator41]TNH00688.1 penicillin-binding protein 1B [Pasteurellaceae bacterium UScroc31]TNH02110.1 penicillin-binding protein 1B [Pasteurellaceae bacterium USgator11]